MKHLQNTPLTRVYPAQKASWGEAYAQLGTGLKTGLSVVATATAFFALVVVMGISDALSRGDGSIVMDLQFLGILLGVIGSTVVIGWTIHHHRDIALKEQQQYYKLGAVPELQPIQRQALRLNLVTVFYSGGWSETLEQFPNRVRLQGKAFKPTAFDVDELDLAQQGLNDDWAILNNKQYLKTVRQLLEGMHTPSFAYDIQSERSVDLVERLSGLTRLPESYILACNEPSEGRPKRLIWGFDLWRAIVLSRHAYMAGYATEEEAWSYLLKAAELVYFLFDDYKDFFDNYRLGNAYWSNDFEITKPRLEQWKFFEERCDWPIRTLPWERQQPTELPEGMATNFEPWLEEQKPSSNTPIGFKRPNEEEE